MAAGGGGAAVGTLLGRYIGKGYADALQGQLEGGGILLWVACQDPEHEGKAMTILQRHGAGDVRVHELPTPNPALYTPGGVSYDVSFMNRIGL